MKAIFQILLALGVIALGYWVYVIFKTPIEFQRESGIRKEAVIDRLKDIRTAQRSFRSKYSRFAGSFDELINYIKTDSMAIEMQIGSEDDSLARATGRVLRLATFIPVRDTIFNNRKAKSELVVDDIRYIPYSETSNGGKLMEFKMDTISILTESKVIVPVFEAFAPYTTFLGDLDKQELINFRDEQVNTLNRADGLKVGSLEGANNEAGNWE